MNELKRKVLISLFNYFLFINLFFSLSNAIEKKIGTKWKIENQQSTINSQVKLN